MNPEPTQTAVTATDSSPLDVDLPPEKKPKRPSKKEVMDALKALGSPDAELEYTKALAERVAGEWRSEELPRVLAQRTFTNLTQAEMAADVCLKIAQDTKNEPKTRINAAQGVFMANRAFAELANCVIRVAKECGVKVAPRPPTQNLPPDLTQNNFEVHVHTGDAAVKDKDDIKAVTVPG